MCNRRPVRRRRPSRWSDSPLRNVIPCSSRLRWTTTSPASAGLRSGRRRPFAGGHTGPDAASGPDAARRDREPPAIDLAPIEGPPTDLPGLGVPNLTPNPGNQPPEIEALPGQGDSESNERPPTGPPGQRTPINLAPITPGTQRATSIRTRGGRPLDFQKIAVLPDGTEIYVCRGGVNIITRADKLGIIDIEADQAVIWRGPSRKKGEPIQGPNGEWIDDADNQPMELYLEGNVIVRQDQRKWAGKGDQRTLRAPRVYYNFLTDRLLAHEAEMDMFTPGLLAPYKISRPGSSSSVP